MEKLIEISGPVSYGSVRIENPDNEWIARGVTAVVGPNGSGKTTLGRALAKGRHAFANSFSYAPGLTRIKMLEFTDIHAWTGVDVDYAQQRLEATMNQFVPTVRDVLGDKVSCERWTELAEAFCLGEVVDKKINYLSSGELRKLTIINALLSDAQLLILDNPYIGLDRDGRSELNRMLLDLRESGVSTLLLVCDDSELPGFEDKKLHIDNRRLGAESFQVGGLQEVSLPSRSMSNDFVTAFSIRDGAVRYGDRIVFEHLDWTVRRGEKWALTGPNGSGKSMLLSMMYGDHPQAYSNEIVLFDRMRGSGESIWEIKDRMGYVSVEEQLYFRSQRPVAELIAQARRPAMRRFGALTSEELAEAREWLRLFGMDELAGRLFSTLSTGEQRMVLLARQISRQPDLLVLDEPFNGIDPHNRATVTSILRRLDTTLIFVSHTPAEYATLTTRTMTLAPH